MPQFFADKVVNVRLCDTVISAAAVNYTFHRGKGNKTPDSQCCLSLGPGVCGHGPPV